MLKKLILLLPLLAFPASLFTDAWSRPATPPSQPAMPDFVAQPRDPQPKFNAQELLDRAIAQVDPATTPWLRVEIAQSSHHRQASFEATGYLQTAPHGCRHLELNLKREGNLGKLLTISDGRVTARISHWPPAEPEIVTADIDQNSPNQFIGPFGVLTQLRQKARHWTCETGLWKNQPVVCLRSELQGKRVSVYLQDHWPLAVEWYEGERRSDLVEFRNPERRELSYEDCTREFTYRPIAAE